MGTRADFYVGRGEKAEWLGSIAWDGNPEPYVKDGLFADGDEAEWRARVSAFLATRDDATVPSDGWPWPWEDSRTTDYAYALDGGSVWGSCFGSKWFKANETKPEHDDGSPQDVVFPNMKDKQNVTLGKRSGVLVFGG